MASEYKVVRHEPSLRPRLLVGPETINRIPSSILLVVLEPVHSVLLTPSFTHYNKGKQEGRSIDRLRKISNYNPLKELSNPGSLPTHL